MQSETRYFVKRDDGLYLCGDTATRVSPDRPAPFASLRAAMKAIDWYRMSCAFHAPEHKADNFSILQA